MVRTPGISFESTRGPLDRALSTRETQALDPAAQRAIAQWIELLCAWNARIDLTAARSGEELVDLMLADALVLAPRVKSGARVVDVGTGAGAPGLAIALARPDLAITLCEPLTKRASFLRTVVGTVARADVAIERVRGDELRSTWDVAMSRATLAPAEWLALGARLVGHGGSVWVLLAKDEPPRADGATIAEDVAYEWPETRAARRAVRYVID